ncbi:alpha-xenorhabdolysin family binary toxin subunit A [Pseudomonas xanthosomatis]|uniref:alpha-xenorhabdolysin family binary toxin subunit A n=1 Tax=Pseudomonas xanthosomatis TaxID=2842356 RepID=UPI001C3C3E87|nr:alpha-xenorhabdolysin family binary toxin subunit A [Pseudomonas xanthosomatis]QXH48011.1 alpha-xenorhabdolysin family binary toxin subunit A [Pseudomonas xanthosomatis]
MNPRQLHYDTLQAKAIVLPGALIEAMYAREGAGQAGLLLTRPALQALDAYRASVQRMPSDVAKTKEWLGYEQISEPELTPQRMLLLFQQLRVHGNAWTVLRVQCQQVTSGLQRHADSIEAQGRKVLALAARTRALGANKGSWESLQLAPPAALDTHDLQLLAAMGGELVRLHGLVDDYDQQVDTLRIGLQTFRDTARERLVPSIVEKCRAARRFASSPEADNLSWELGMLNEDIKAARRDYQRYSKQSSSGWVGGPFGFLISSSIYGRKAKEARAEQRRLEQRHQQLSQRLAQHRRVEGRVNQLDSEMQLLETELWDVVLASGHLHTAWQTIEAYLESAMERLQRMSTRQQLATFMFHFRQFLSQWVAIGEHARGMNKVFE